MIPNHLSNPGPRDLFSGDLGHIHSPSPYEMAVLAYHTCHSEIRVGKLVKVAGKRFDQLTLSDWYVQKVFNEKQKLPNRLLALLGMPQGYHGVLYYNAKKRQLVWAHRSTKLTNISAFRTNVNAIVQNAVSVQEALLPDLLYQCLAERETLSKKHQKPVHLSITGHSLGGWLAQVTAMVAAYHYPDHHCKVVTFDTPGALPMLQQMQRHLQPLFSHPMELDITNYLSVPNLVNSCNPHIGTSYQVIFDDFPGHLAFYTITSHLQFNFLHAFDPKSNQIKKIAHVQQWPLLPKEILQKEAETIDKGLQMLKKATWFRLPTLFKALRSIYPRTKVYKSFFKFVKQVNQNHVIDQKLQQKDPTIAHHTYAYHVMPFDPYRLHKRHIPLKVQRLLAMAKKDKPQWAQILAKNPSFASIHWDQDQQILITPKRPTKVVIDQLMKIAANLPDNQQRFLCNAKHGILLLGPIPPVVTFFTGRKTILAQLRKRLLNSPDNQLVICPITGPSGVGKTQLVLQFIKKQADNLPYQRIIWLPMDHPQKLHQVFFQLARKLNIHITGQESTVQVAKQVKSKLRHEHNLYILDNLDPASQVNKSRSTTQWIQDAYLPYQGHVVLTSRNSNQKVWPKKAQPLVTLPSLTLAEVRTLAKVFSIAPARKENQDFIKLLSAMPRWPIILVHLLSIFFHKRYQTTFFLSIINHTQQFLDLLKEKPHLSLGYDKTQTMLSCILSEESVATLKKSPHKTTAFVLLQHLAYLNIQNIPLAFLYTLGNRLGITKPVLRAHLAALEGESLVRWHRHTEMIYINRLVQTVVQSLHPAPSLDHLVCAMIDDTGTFANAGQYVQKWRELLLPDAQAYEQLGTTIKHLLKPRK